MNNETENPEASTELGGRVDSVVMTQSIESLRDLLKVQCSDGNWNYDPYMHGMANGMILAMSLFEGGVPNYLDAPKVWLKDKTDLSKPISESVAS